MRLQPFESSRQRSFKYNSFYNQFDSRNSLMPVEGSTKEAWHAISPNLPFSTVNPSGIQPTQWCSSLMALNAKKETWFLHRIRELELDTLVSESRGTWIARISSIEKSISFSSSSSSSSFLSFFFFFFLFLCT